MCQLVRGPEKLTDRSVGRRVRDEAPEGTWDQAQLCTLVRSCSLCQPHREAIGIMQAWKSHPLTLKDISAVMSHLSRPPEASTPFPDTEGREFEGLTLNENLPGVRALGKLRRMKSNITISSTRKQHTSPYIKLRFERHADCFARAGAKGIQDEA